MQTFRNPNNPYRNVGFTENDTFEGQSDDCLLTSRQVRERYGNVSDMWIWRRLHEEGGTFPQPLVISRRRFWRLSELVAWENSLTKQAA